MDEDILVSIVIPVYNAAPHLESALSSIIAQVYEHIEIIIVNDASTDSSPAIAQTLLENSGRTFRIINHPRNLGVSAARNTGINSAHGKYIWFCDSDDIPDKYFVSSLTTEALHKHADIVFCGLRHYHESTHRLVDEPITFTPDSVSPAKYLDAWASRKLYLWSMWNFLFSRKLITENGLHFHEGCILGEDTEFVLKAIAHASRISCVGEILYTYVHHSGQACTARTGYAKMHHLVLARMRSGNFLLKHTHSKRVRKYILSFYLPDVIVKQFTVCASENDKQHYTRLKRTLKHRVLRKILLSTARYILTEPELFMKSIMLLYAPDIYYLLRK